MPEPTITRNLLIKAEQARMLYSSIGIAGLGTLLLSTVVLWLNGGVSLLPNLVWGGTMLLVSLLYTALWYLWRRSAPEPASSEKWLSFLLPVVLMSGIGWGVAVGYHSPHYADDIPLVTTLLSTVGMMLTVMLLAASGRVVAVFLATALLSLAVTSGYFGIPPSGRVLILLFTAIIAIVVAGAVLSLLLKNNAGLRAGKRNVYGKLYQAREKMSGLHSRLSDGNERRRDVERELVLAKEAAESANMAKTEFLATMSHEIRTPLNSIVPLLEILGGTQLNGEQGQLVRTAHNSSLHLITIIDDILDFSKIEAGKLELESIEIRIKELVESVTAMMAKSAERRGLDLSYKIQPGVPDFVRGDPIRLRQVLTNLVSNAVKFTKKGSIVVEVSRRGIRRKEVELLFSVKDTGIGLDQETQSRLFHSFTQADASTTRTHGGTGLGLAISKRLVELMGGKMGVQSEEGVGSIFYFALSMRKSLRDAPPERYSLQGIRALLVGGDSEEEERCKAMLEQWNIVLQTANSPMDAMGKLSTTANLGESWAYELVIADASQLGSQMSALMRDISRISALSDLKLVAIGSPYKGVRRDKIDGLLPKPVQKNDLHHLLCRVMDVESESHEASTDTTGLGESNRHLLADVEHGQWGDDGDFAVSELVPKQLTGRVLVVEDNPVNLRVARKLLQRLGLESEAALDGLQALKAVDHGDYDLVLMDCQMPIMDGYEATHAIRMREVKRELTRLPIIAMTANAMAGDRQKCLNAGMDDYLSKPILSGTLKSTLEKWLKMGKGSTQASSVSSSPAELLSGAGKAGKAIVSESDTTPSAFSDGKVATAAIDGAVIDREILGELYEIMEDDFLELLETFLKTSPGLIHEIETGIQEGDLQQTMRAAHSLKSGSANLGAIQLSELAKRMEYAARESDQQAVSSSYNETRDAFDIACRELKMICEQGHL
ncbi:MAG: ATP-binding protein [Sedimenticola sp.]